MKKICAYILLFTVLAACESPAMTVPAASEPPPTPTPTVPAAPPPENIVAPTLATNPTATADTRLPPERWTEWLVVPQVTGRAIEIYRAGQAMGLDPHAFSKVGDCQSIRAAFMGYFDIPERYSLGSNYAYLQETIDQFSGRFNTDGQAVKGGFNAAAVLSPLWADPNACLAGENPLECELRTARPVIVIVSLEVWWDGRTPEQYEALMRRILDTIIAHGAVPILATKADNVEGNHSLNLATARLAYEYDLPLWNFWAAVQSLPNRGMDAERADGFHISTEAWSTRSFTGLQALDSVWRGLQAAVPGSAPGQASGPATATPGGLSVPAQTPLPTASPTPGPTPQGGSERIVFGLARRQGEGYEYLGVYLLDLLARQTAQVFGSGVQFQAASPGGRYLLVSQGAALYRVNVDGANPKVITQSLYADGSRTAVWTTDGLIAAILTDGQANTITLFSVDGAARGSLSTSGAQPIELYPGSDSRRLYWEAGTCASPGVCRRGGAWVTARDGSLDRALGSLAGPAAAPDGSRLAYSLPVSSNESDLGLSSPDGSDPRQVPLPGNLLTAHAWSPQGDALAAVVALRSDYSGRVSGNRNFLVDPRTLVLDEYPASSLLSPLVLWSPDGSFLFWIGTLADGDGFAIGGSLVDRRSKQVTDLGAAIGQSGTDYLLVTNAAWLPLP